MKQAGRIQRNGEIVTGTHDYTQGVYTLGCVAVDGFDDHKNATDVSLGDESGSIDEAHPFPSPQLLRC